MPRVRPLRNASLATRVALVALAVTLVSLGVTALVGLQRGADLAGDITDDRLVSVAAARGESVQLSMTSIRREIGALAASPGTAAAVADLTEAFRGLDRTSVAAADQEDLTQFYLTDVVPALEEVRSAQVGASFLVPDDPGAVYLQRHYTVPDDTGIEPSLVLDPGDGSEYSALHPSVHQTYGQIALSSGFDDLFLISADDHVVVYSLQKRIDFATSLDVGPHSGSALARVVEQLEADPSSGPLLTDYTAYVPASERPVAFVAAAVRDEDGAVVGHLAAALSIDLVDEILSGSGSWDGFGESGEAYLVGADGTMRSTARTFQASASEFLASAPEQGPGQLTDAQRRRMAETGTTALVQETSASTRPDGDGSTITDATSYRGVETRTAVRALAVDGVDWTIVAEIEREELRAPIRDYARAMLFAVALFVVAVTFVVARWSDRLVRPIRRIATRLRLVRTSEADATPSERSPEDGVAGPEEYEQLSANVDEMLERLRERQAEITAQSAERAALLRQFLPAAVARRSEEGEGEVLDHVRSASVVVMTLDGLGDLLGGDDPSQAHDLLATVVDDVDALATEAGLERVKVTGTTYYAVCGVSRPVLDHAPRSVRFALEARDLVTELSGGRLSARGAVASGPVSTGLAARAALVYDVWGDTVATAASLARHAAPATVVVTDAVRGQLPRDFETTGDPGGPAVVTGRVDDRTEVDR